MDSILISIRKMLGIVANCSDFDDVLIVHINSVFAILHQLGVGPVDGFGITGTTEKWSDFISGDPYILRDVKTYIYEKVRLVFDPPQNSALLGSIKEVIHELECRLNYTVDPGKDQEGI